MTPEPERRQIKILPSLWTLKRQTKKCVRNKTIISKSVRGDRMWTLPQNERLRSPWGATACEPYLKTKNDKLFEVREGRLRVNPTSKNRMTSITKSVRGDRMWTLPQNKNWQVFRSPWGATAREPYLKTKSVKLQILGVFAKRNHFVVRELRSQLNPNLNPKVSINKRSICSA